MKIDKNKGCFVALDRDGNIVKSAHFDTTEKIGPQWSEQVALKKASRWFDPEITHIYELWITSTNELLFGLHMVRGSFPLTPDYLEGCEYVK